DIVNSDDTIISQVTFCCSDEELNHVKEEHDLAIICASLMFEHKTALFIRGLKLAKLIVYWLWDNHHNYLNNINYATPADIIIPAHAYDVSYLRVPHSILGKSIPLCSSQFARKFVADTLAKHSSEERNASLYGGFVAWESERVAL